MDSFKIEYAIKKIKEILQDDKNYQTSTLKLGCIWDICDTYATFVRSKHSDGNCVEVKEKVYWE